MKKRMLMANMALTTAMALFCLKGLAQTQMLDRIAAVVGDQIITLSDVVSAERHLKQNLVAAKQPIPESDTFRQRVLTHLIDRQLQLNEAKQIGIKVTDAEIRSTIKRIEQQQRITDQQFRKQLSHEGQQYKTFVAMMRDHLTVMRLQRQVLVPTLKVSKTKIDRFIKQYREKNSRAHLVDWLLEVPEGASAMVWREQKDQGRLLRNQLIAGETPNATVGAVRSDLGWRSVMLLPNIFIKAIQHAAVGDTIGPIRAPNGIHIIRVVDMEEGVRLTRAQASEVVYGQALSQALPAWLKKLRAKTHVEVMSADHG